MPMYPYYIATQFGNDWPFDTETNIPPQLPPNVIASLHWPSPEIKTIGRALIFSPVLDLKTNGLILENGETLGLDAIKNLIGTDITSLLNSDVPVFMGNPVYSNDLSWKPIHYVYIPSLGLAVGFVATLIIAVVIALILIMAATVPEEIRRYHELDLAAESQQEVGREYVDVDTGEIQSEYFEGADIERIYYKNGDIHVLALNQRGYDFLGGQSTAMEREGIDWDQLLKDLEDRWGLQNIINMALYLGIGIVGIYAVVKIIPLIFKRKPPQPQYYPPPSENQ